MCKSIPMIINETCISNTTPKFSQWKDMQTAKIKNQGDMGGNNSTTNNLNIIHGYKEFSHPESVGFLQDTKEMAILMAQEEKNVASFLFFC